jgi:hypothetical protein
MAKESEADKNKSNIFSSIGALVGMVAGGPVGAALGGGLGALAGGSSPQEAIQSGIGGLFSAGLGGKAGLALNALGAMSGGGGGGGANAFLGGGGGGGLQNQGASLVNLLSGKQGQQLAAKQAMLGGFQGGPTGALRGIMQAAGIEDAQGRTDPILGGLLQQALFDQRKVNFDPVMTDLEQAQYASGERRPGYRGTAAPGTPTVSYRPKMMNMGGYIEGPGTGTSDSIPATIYQNGGPVQEARLSDGEFVMTADAVRGAGGGDRNAGAAKMYEMMNQFERVA